MAAAVAAAVARASAPPRPSPGPAAAAGEVRDMYGFAVKPEFQELYQRFEPIYAADESERAGRWSELMAEVEGLLPR